MDKCPICNEELQHPSLQFNNEISGFTTEIPNELYQCNNCGKFALTLGVVNTRTYFNISEKEQTLNNLRILAMIRKNIYLHYSSYNKHFLINSQILKNIEEQSFPSPMEQIERFILFIGHETQNAGNTFDIDFANDIIIDKKLNMSNKSKLFSYVPFINYANYEYILKYAEEYISKDGGLNNHSLALTLNGWKKYEELKRGQNNSHKAFMAMQYDNKELKQLFEDIIKPGLKELGFEINRLDKTNKSGLIDENLRVEIRDSKFLVVDLSDGNKGAYWEAGYGEGLNKKIFYICDKQQFDTVKNLIHFDVSHQQLYFWNENNSENPNKFIDSLKAGIRLAFPEIK